MDVNFLHYFKSNSEPLILERSFLTDKHELTHSWQTNSQQGDSTRSSSGKVVKQIQALCSASWLWPV